MIFKVKMEYRGVAAYEVEASDDETAEETAVDMLRTDVNKHIEVIDAVVTKSDNQYTAEQELQDDERRNENKG